jgi:hypothetical protein
VFIKTHPNGINGCKEQTIEMVERFNCSYFHILDETISNLNIIELKPNLIVTARGTIGLEMAYFGISTVALFDNPYVNFDFVHTCYDLDSYFKIIRGDLEVLINFEKRQIYSFYAQAFLECNVSNQYFKIIEDQSNGTYDDLYLEKILSTDELEMKKEMIEFYSTAFNEIV